MKTTILILAGCLALAGNAMGFEQSHLQSVLAGNPCLECDLSGANLENANLEGLILGFANFQGANLRGVNLKGASLGGAIFVEANLQNADLRKTQAPDALFMGANLTNAKLDGAWLDGAQFGAGRFEGKDYPAANFEGASFAGVDMSRVKGLKPTSPFPETAIVPGGPNKDFLGTEIYVIAGGSPMAGGFSVHQIVDALGDAKKTWEAKESGQWLLTIQKDDRESGKRVILEMLFTRHRTDDESGVLLAQATMNGQKMTQGQIFQLAQQLALKAEAKQ